MAEGVGLEPCGHAGFQVFRVFQGNQRTSPFSGGAPLNKWTLRTRYDDARAAAAKAAAEADNFDLAAKIKAFQFRDIRPKAARNRFISCQQTAWPQR